MKSPQGLKEPRLPDINDFFPSKFLRASDTNQGYDAVVDRVEPTNVGTDEKPDRKPVVWWADPDHKPVVLNATRRDAMIEIAKTTDYTKWKGVRVHISKGWTRYMGERKECIVIGPPEVPF